jgi:hypothetical protein
VNAPVRNRPLPRPRGAPPNAPCMRQTTQPFTAAPRHRCPDRFDLAEQRGDTCIGRRLCMGLIGVSAVIPGPAHSARAAGHDLIGHDRLVGVDCDVPNGGLLLAMSAVAAATDDTAPTVWPARLPALGQSFMRRQRDGSFPASP